MEDAQPKARAWVCGPGNSRALVYVGGRGGGVRRAPTQASGDLGLLSLTQFQRPNHRVLAQLTGELEM
jgi:hypothetical protein